MNIERIGKRKLLIPLFGIGFAIMAAIPGALIGVIIGLFKFPIIAAIIGAIFFFFTYPSSRIGQGLQTSIFTWFLALCGPIGGGLSCYYIGELVSKV